MMMVLIAAHVALAVLLFQLVNWIGEHATDFGYASTTLFEEPSESLALNFFIRALAPAVFMVALSAVVVATGYPDLRYGVYWIAIYYYVLRLIYIPAMNMHRLVSWRRFAFHSSVGLAAAWIAYQSLILPNRSLLPNLDTAGNELWLAIFAFLYTVANKVTVAGGPGDRRRNLYITNSFKGADQLYGVIIDKKISDDRLKLIVYSVIIFENYCRPPLIRLFERALFWKKRRTTGIMQMSSLRTLTDTESVELGTDKLLTAWNAHAHEDIYTRTRSTVTDFNRDNTSFNRVMEVMEILAKRAEPRFRPAYEAIAE